MLDKFVGSLYAVPVISLRHNKHKFVTKAQLDMAVSRLYQVDKNLEHLEQILVSLNISEEYTNNVKYLAGMLDADLGGLDDNIVYYIPLDVITQISDKSKLFNTSDDVESMATYTFIRNNPDFIKTLPVMTLIGIYENLSGNFPPEMAYDIFHEIYSRFSIKIDENTKTRLLDILPTDVQEFLNKGVLENDNKEAPDIDLSDEDLKDELLSELMALSDKIKPTVDRRSKKNTPAKGPILTPNKVKTRLYDIRDLEAEKNAFHSTYLGIRDNQEKLCDIMEDDPEDNDSILNMYADIEDNHIDYYLSICKYDYSVIIESLPWKSARHLIDFYLCSKYSYYPIKEDPDFETYYSYESRVVEKVNVILKKMIHDSGGNETFMKNCHTDDYAIYEYLRRVNV